MKRRKLAALLALALLLPFPGRALENAAGELEIFWEREGVLEAGEQPSADIAYTVLRTLEPGQTDAALPWSEAWTRDYRMQQIAYESPVMGRETTGWIVTEIVERAPVASPALTARYDTLLTVPGQEGELHFAARNKAVDSEVFTKAGAADMTLTDAFRRALDALMEKYGETEGTLQRFQLNYGFCEESAYFEAPYWQFDLRHPANPLDSYEIMVHSPDGVVLYTVGPGEGNG